MLKNDPNFLRKELKLVKVDGRTKSEGEE